MPVDKLYYPTDDKTPALIPFEVEFASVIAASSVIPIYCLYRGWGNILLTSAMIIVNVYLIYFTLCNFSIIMTINVLFMFSYVKNNIPPVTKFVIRMFLILLIVGAIFYYKPFKNEIQ